MTELSSLHSLHPRKLNTCICFTKAGSLTFSNSQTLVSLTSYKESRTRTSLSHILNFIVSQTKVHLEVHLLSDECASIVSQTIVHRLTVSQTIVHRLTNESASRSSSSHRRKCIVSQTQVELELVVSQTEVHLHRLTNEPIVSQTEVHLEVHRLTVESASSHKRK